VRGWLSSCICPAGGEWMSRTLLVLFAHPDDETFATGGTLAHYARRGVRTLLGCATRGEAGVVHEEGAEPPEDMGKVREEELRCACRTLGVEEVRFLDYRDSGMVGSPDNEHPRAFVRADPEEVAGRILSLFREFRPQVVITFGPDGGYGHPDHVAIHRHTVEAWQRAGDPERCPDLAQDPPRKLYYLARPRHYYRRMRQMMWQMGLLEQAPAEEEVQRLGVPDEKVTTTVDIRDVLELKYQALRCHRTQLPPDSPWRNLPLDLLREYLGYEFFTLAAVRGEEIVTGEDDLFAGLAT